MPTLCAMCGEPLVVRVTWLQIVEEVYEQDENGKFSLSYETNKGNSELSDPTPECKNCYSLVPNDVAVEVLGVDEFGADDDELTDDEAMEEYGSIIINGDDTQATRKQYELS